VFNGNNKADAQRRAYYSRWNKETEKLELIEERVKRTTNFNIQQMGLQNYCKPIIKQAIHLIRTNNEKEIKTNLPQILLEQLYAQATYDPGMFIDKNGDPKFKDWDEIPENYRCCVEGIETNWHGKDADRKSVKIKLVDREKARKYLTKLCPSIFVPEKLEHVIKTIDKEGKEVGIDYSKMSEEELRTLYKKISEREKNGK
jgi:hypothetical protein